VAKGSGISQRQSAESLLALDLEGSKNCSRMKP